ncbi:hypothetical protein LHA31_10135 [Carnobacterium viridans]|uniref:hypothetical protein n=1 Tax=Carnobacterium viridans TaxID=174587 RepID=UPI001CFF59D3|nr:hypothetical protein [Carnobacterium viridans]UDE94904.1 hypothetical protein LHA31_10135 [Carnobacterium viridans]
MTKQLRDFLYIDEDIVENLYAQLYQKEIVEQIFNDSSQSGISQNNSETTSSTDGIKPSVTASAVVLKAQISGSSSITDTNKTAVVTSESQGVSESTKFALNRFKYSEVIDSLRDKGLLKDKYDFQKYDFLEIENNFRYFDYDQHTDIYDHEGMLILLFANYYITHDREITYDKIISDLSAAKVAVKNIKKLSFFENQADAKEFIAIYASSLNFRRVGLVSIHLNKIFKNNVLFFSKENDLVICNKNFLKTDTLLLTLSQNVSAKVIGKVINDPTLIMDTGDVSNYFTDDERLTSDLINAGASFLVMNYLQNFYGLKKNYL